MRSRICIAILECDEPAGPETRSKYGGFGNMFKELLEAGITQVAEVDSINRPELILTKHDVVHAMAYPDPDDVDAVLLTGSRTYVQMSREVPADVRPRRSKRV